MLTIKQNNLRILAIEHGERVNNYIDCDVIYSGIQTLKGFDEYADAQHVSTAICFLDSAINYRKQDAKSTKYAEDFLDSMKTDLEA